MTEIGQSLNEMTADKSISAVVITGSEKAFAGNVLHLDYLLWTDI